MAEERGEKWPDDAKRPLSHEGIVRLRRSVRGLVRLDVSLDAIVTSPLVRTRQTAEIVAAGLDVPPPVSNLESLAPGGSTTAVIADLGKYSRRTRVGIVGHEPGIGELAARLVGSRHALTFKKGAMCRIDVEGLPPSGPGDLQWFLTARILRKLRT